VALALKRGSNETGMASLGCSASEWVNGKGIFMSKDYGMYELAGLSCAYETIGSLNLFMVCKAPSKSAFCGLP
jgi:hypothetical protein